MGVKENYQRALQFAKMGRYEEAQSLLVGIDNPKAQALLDRINQTMLTRQSRQVQPAPSARIGVTHVSINQNNNPGCIVQVLFFLFLGWYLGFFWIAIAWGLMISVIGMPVAIWMINRVSQVIALRSPTQRLSVTSVDGHTTVRQGSPQNNILIRIIWFFLIGLWISPFWMTLAYAFCLTIFLMPVGFWMFDKTPALLTLQRS
jgi:uncharacterized membrane protein YccF (DUF307 family)